MAYPNLDIGGSRLTIYLEQANRILNSLAHNAPNQVSGANIRQANAVSTALPSTKVPQVINLFLVVMLVLI